MQWLYYLLTYLLVPFAVLRLYWRARRAPDYRRRIGERFARFDMPKAMRGGIWIHAVSVGEVLAAQPLIHVLRQQYPSLPLLVTCMTPTGSERIQLNLPSDVFHVYAPYDVPYIVTRFLNKTRPRLAIFIETELWPSILTACQRRGIPTLLANARLSEKSAQGYHRWLVRGIAKNMLHALTIIAAQSTADAKRFVWLGADASRVKVVGSMKFDFDLPQSSRESVDLLKAQLGGARLTWIAASTHEGEEGLLLAAHQAICAVYPKALLILVPRHPERFDKVALLIEKQGLSVARRSQQQLPTQTDQVYLGDTMGELRLLLGAADVVFMGGSLVPVGGHNMLEAALYRLPILTGPQTFNFAETTRLLLEAGGLQLVSTTEELTTALLALFADSEQRERQGEKAYRVLEANRGALEKHMQLIKPLLQPPHARDV